MCHSTSEKVGLFTDVIRSLFAAACNNPEREQQEAKHKNSLDDAGRYVVGSVRLRHVPSSCGVNDG